MNKNKTKTPKSPARRRSPKQQAAFVAAAHYDDRIKPRRERARKASLPGGPVGGSTAKIARRRTTEPVVLKHGKTPRIVAGPTEAEAALEAQPEIIVDEVAFGPGGETSHVRVTRRARAIATELAADEKSTAAKNAVKTPEEKAIIRHNAAVKANATRRRLAAAKAAPAEIAGAVVEDQLAAYAEVAFPGRF